MLEDRGTLYGCQETYDSVLFAGARRCTCTHAPEAVLLFLPQHSPQAAFFGFIRLNFPPSLQLTCSKTTLTLRNPSFGSPSFPFVAFFWLLLSSYISVYSPPTLSPPSFSCPSLDLSFFLPSFFFHIISFLPISFPLIFPVPPSLLSLSLATSLHCHLSATLPSSPKKTPVACNIFFSFVAFLKLHFL